MYKQRYIPGLLTAIIVVLFLSLSMGSELRAQDDDEPILYFQMEPLDDSLFINIQLELFIDPPDPKAEIIADLRDPNNQTISIKGALYPFLAVSPELRARIITYPFKINLDEQIHFASVFTRVFEKIRFARVATPPTKLQISPTAAYINPFVQLFGGERFGIPIKDDIGISFGFGTRYSGALETNFFEVNFNILGFYGGLFRGVDAVTEIKSSNNHNNLFVTEGIQLGYVIPFGNFFEVSYLNASKKFSDSQKRKYLENTINKDNLIKNSNGSIMMQPYLVEGSYVNWEFRYPISLLGSTRGKFYVAQFLDEWHVGYTGRELSAAGSTFDFRFDAMFNSPIRQNQFVVDIMVQKIFGLWGFSSFALGPSAVISKTKNGSYGFTSVFANFRMKLGTSL